MHSKVLLPRILHCWSTQVRQREVKTNGFSCSTVKDTLTSSCMISSSAQVALEDLFIMSDMQGSICNRSCSLYFGTICTSTDFSLLQPPDVSFTVCHSLALMMPQPGKKQWGMLSYNQINLLSDSVPLNNF